MPNLTGFAALDVAIGLAFLFFLLSTVCSAINEGIASAAGWRAKNLEDAIVRLLHGTKAQRPAVGGFLGGAVKTAKLALQAVPLMIRGDKKPTAGPGCTPPKVLKADELPAHLAAELFAHWRVTALVRDPDSPRIRNSRPSYLPARAFSRALTEVIAGLPIEQPHQGPGRPESVTLKGEPTVWEKTDTELLAAVKEKLNSLPAGPTRDFLERAAGIAGTDIEHFRTQLETAFNDTMERASGWYKRHVQFVLALIAVGVTVGLNVDSVRVADRLWKNPEVRAAVVAKANAPATGSKDEQTVADTVSQVKQLSIPIGWGAGNAPSGDASHVVWGIVRRIPGWIFTIIALSLGAPFWFDLLSRLSRLRGSGVPEQPRALSDSATPGHRAARKKEARATGQ
jgi:hypothetical protein